MHDDRVLIERRIERILRERLRPAVHGVDVPLAVEVWHAPGEPVAVAEALRAPYRPARAGAAWGPAWGTSWFHLTGSVPDAWAGRPVEAVIDLGFATDRPGFSAEALVHRPDGTALKGLNPVNTWLRVADRAEAGQPVDLYVEAAANPLVEGVGTPLGELRTAGRDPLYRVRRVVLAVFGARAAARLELGVTAAAATGTDLLERPSGAAARFDGTGVDLALRPFQVVTLRFTLAGARQP